MAAHWRECKEDWKMATTEFFKTLAEAEAFQPICLGKDVFGLDKPGTVRKFREWQDDAIANERYYAEKARAVVVIYR
jgi:hypothetical protein